MIVAPHNARGCNKFNFYCNSTELLGKSRILIAERILLAMGMAAQAKVI